jgi:hypothetical protein
VASRARFSDSVAGCPDRHRIAIVYRLLTAALLCALLMGCGGSDRDSTATTPREEATTTPEQATTDTSPGVAGAELLDAWSARVLPALVTAQDRGRAFEAGQTDKAARLERRFNRQLEDVQRFGREAPVALADHAGTEEAEAVSAAGEAWTEWAYETRTNPPAGDFTQAQKIADLGALAVRRHQEAYEAVGAEPPAAFQSR